MNIAKEIIVSIMVGNMFSIKILDYRKIDYIIN
jgi:hypothetical protein